MIHSFSVTIEAPTPDEARAWISNALMDHADRRHGLNATSRVKDDPPTVRRVPRVQVTGDGCVTTIT